MALLLIDLLSSKSTEHKLFADWIYAKLSSIIDEVCSGQNINDNHLWQKFHSLRSSVDFCDKWKSFLTKEDLEPNPMIYQHITQELFETIIDKKLEIRETARTNSTVKLTAQEENVVRYIGGYVMRMLKKSHPQDK